MLRKKDAELTGGSAPTIFYVFEKVNARVEPAAAAQCLPRPLHSPRVVPFVQLFAALGSPKRRNPMPHGAHTSKLDVSLCSCRACEIAASSGRDPCRGWVMRARGAFPVFGRRWVGRGCSGHCSASVRYHICMSGVVLWLARVVCE